jgi:UrcA family protein
MTMNAAIRYTLAAILAGSLTAGVASPAAADELPQHLVRFGDLDPNHLAGTTILYSRIRIAAEQVCEPLNARALSSVAAAHRCMEQAVARAVAEVNVPALSSYHSQQTEKFMIVARK